MVAPDNDPVPSCVHKIVQFVALAPDTVIVSFEQIVALPPALAVGKGFTITVYVAVASGEHPLVLVTVIVKVTVFQASAATGVYVGVNVVASDNEPAPSCVHKIVPFDELAPPTVTKPFEQIVVLPPDAAVGNGSTITV